MSGAQRPGSGRHLIAPRQGAPGDVFTPTKPKTGRGQLVGRDAELQTILQALREENAHVVLYSERGRGKTSLANIAVETLRRAGSIVARHTCEAGTRFDDLMRGLMRDLPPSLLATRGGFDAPPDHRAPYSPAGAMASLTRHTAHDDDGGCVAALPDRDLRPRDIVMLPERLTCRSLVCVVDEFDRVEDHETRMRLADTIKQLSDSGAPLLFLIVGVSENLDQILGQHPSIERAVVGIHLTLFSDEDVAQLIARGGREAGIVFPASIVARISILARGMPHMAQLFGLRLSQAVRARGDVTVLPTDFDLAVERLVRDAGPRTLARYAALTDSGRDATMMSVLRRIAAAPQDAWGRIAMRQSAEGQVRIGDTIIPAACWDRLREAGVMQPVVAHPGLFVFGQRAVMHYVLLLAASESAVVRRALPTEPDTEGTSRRPAAHITAVDVRDGPHAAPVPALVARAGFRLRG